MRITCLFGQRKSQPESIELMVAWDEYCIDNYPEGFEADCKKAKESWGSDLLQWRLVELKTSSTDLVELFTTPTLEGKITE